MRHSAELHAFGGSVPRRREELLHRAAQLCVVVLAEHFGGDVVKGTTATGSVGAVDVVVDVEGELEGVQRAGRTDLVVGLAMQHRQDVVDHLGVLVGGRQV
jgi:hypothetical protein